MSPVGDSLLETVVVMQEQLFSMGFVVCQSGERSVFSPAECILRLCLVHRVSLTILLCMQHGIINLLTSCQKNWYLESMLVKA